MDTLEALKMARNDMKVQIDLLKKDLDALDRIISRQSGQATLTCISNVPVANRNSVGPTEAIKDFFQKNPSKEIRASQLISVLERMKEEGLLETQSKSIRDTTTSTLRNLIKVGFLSRSGSRKRVFYCLSDKVKSQQSSK